MITRTCASKKIQYSAQEGFSPEQARWCCGRSTMDCGSSVDHVARSDDDGVTIDEARGVASASWRRSVGLGRSAITGAVAGGGLSRRYPDATT
jgi:hypothetical protein